MFFRSNSKWKSSYVCAKFDALRSAPTFKEFVTVAWRIVFRNRDGSEGSSKGGFDSKFNADGTYDWSGPSHSENQMTWRIVKGSASAIEAVQVHQYPIISIGRNRANWGWNMWNSHVTFRSVAYGCD